jgi:hypothetical protein
MHPTTRPRAKGGDVAFRQRFQATHENIASAIVWMPPCRYMSQWASSVCAGTVKKARTPDSQASQPDSTPATSKPVATDDKFGLPRHQA